MDYKKSLHEILSLEEFLQDDSDQTDEEIKAELLEDGIDANLALEAFKKKVEDAYWKELENERALIEKKREGFHETLIQKSRNELEKMFKQLIGSPEVTSSNSLLAFRERNPSTLSDDELREMISNIKDLLDDNHSS